VLLHVIDASHHDWEAQRQVVREVLDELGIGGTEQISVFNKMDRLTQEEEDALRERVRALETGPAVFVSAHQPASLEALLETLRVRARARLAQVVVRVPVVDGQTLAELYQRGEVLGRKEEDDVIVVMARVPEALRGRLAARPGVEVRGVE
jgi:GTP-binding protein HflX